MHFSSVMKSHSCWMCCRTSDSTTASASSPPLRSASLRKSIFKQQVDPTEKKSQVQVGMQSSPKRRHCDDGGDRTTRPTRRDIVYKHKHKHNQTTKRCTTTNEAQLHSFMLTFDPLPPLPPTMSSRGAIQPLPLQLALARPTARVGKPARLVASHPYRSRARARRRRQGPNALW